MTGIGELYFEKQKLNNKICSSTVIIYQLLYNSLQTHIYNTIHIVYISQQYTTFIYIIFKEQKKNNNIHKCNENSLHGSKSVKPCSYCQHFASLESSPQKKRNGKIYGKKTLNNLQYKTPILYKCSKIKFQSIVWMESILYYINIVYDGNEKAFQGNCNEFEKLYFVVNVICCVVLSKKPTKLNEFSIVFYFKFLGLWQSSVSINSTEKNKMKKEQKDLTHQILN